jgi:hypothetical protein
MGRIPGTVPGRVAGANRSVRASSPESITSQGSSYTFPTEAQTLRVKAGDAADSAAGVGARAITLVYLDENFIQQTETLTTNGNSASAPTTGLAMRIISTQVTSVGTRYGANVGTVNIEQSVAGTLVDRIVAGEGLSRSALYTVPAGYTMLITRVWAHVTTANTARVLLEATKEVDDITPPYGCGSHLVWDGIDIQGPYSETFESYIVVPAKTDLLMQGQRVEGSQDATVAAGWDFLLVTN